MTAVAALGLLAEGAGVARVALALKRLLAVAVLAAGGQDALGAVGAGPARVAT